MYIELNNFYQCSCCKKIVYGKEFMLVWPQWSMQHFCSEKCKQKYIIENKVDEYGIDIWQSKLKTYKIGKENRKESLFSITS